MKRRSIFCLVCFLSCAGVAWSQRISTQAYNLRNHEPREWSEFPVNAEKELRLTFQAKTNRAEQTLRLRQYDVKQHWRVTINDRDLGLLIVDEKDITTYFAIPKLTLRDGENDLSIRCDDATPDDIRVQAIAIETTPLDDLLTESQIEYIVTEKGTKKSLPCRLTILNADGSLQTLKAEGNNLAVRPGCIYTADGHALFTLPAGKYTIYVNRGFEYGVEKRVITAKPSHRLARRVTLSREVDTRGWTSSDTHIHTFTHSGHGDATDRERVITLAGEGIELAFITEHNKNIDLTSTAKNAGVSPWLTVVTGTEVTTPVGHFNVFPIPAGSSPINHHVDEWQTLLKNIGGVARSPVIILNHARDVHDGFRPMDSVVSHSPKWKLPANAMEVLNSGSQQSDILQLFRDWQDLLNAGYRLTPVGSSDSHDVNRFIVGQGRVYVKSNDEDPGHINVAEAIRNFRVGKVMVSSGLLTSIRVNNQYGPGDSVPYISNVPVEIWVEGPSWVNANKVMLYVNGKKVGDRDIKATSRITKWHGTFQATIPVTGAFITAVALGPANNTPFWPIAKPFQPTSPEWKPQWIGITGAVWVAGQSKAK